MKTKIIFICVVLLMTQAVAFGQKTQVSVQEGKVKAQTESGEVIVDAGKKVILTSDKEPVVIVDNLLVEETMKLYKLVEEERKAQKEKIESSVIRVIKIEDENSIISANFIEVKNAGSEPSNLYQVVSVILEEPKVYDMQGNLLEFDMEKIDDKTGRYTVHFLKPVEPGDNYRCIAVWKERLSEGITKEGPLRKHGSGWIAPNHLSYCRYILPESAIFVGSTRPVTIIDNFDGRIAVTVRIYTGPVGDGADKVAFLWPDKDGTSIADLPPQYRGLRNQHQKEIVREGQLAIAKILAGDTYNDQSTPLKTLLTFISAVVHKDKELFVRLLDDSIKQIAAQQYDQFIDAYGSLVLDFEFLDTPQWPENPENGFTHPVYLCRKGSLLRAVTITMVYRDGKWYWLNNALDG